MRTNREYQVYKAVSMYLKLRYPKVLFHFDLTGVNLSKAAAGMNKAIQKGRGWPDLIILHPHNGKVLFIEIKAEGTSLFKRGVDPFTHYAICSTEHIQEQADVIIDLNSMGHEAHFGVGMDETIAIIDKWLKQA